MKPLALRARAVVLRDALDLMIHSLDRVLEIVQPTATPLHPGEIACMQSRPIEENPHPVDDPEHETWRDNYLCAKERSVTNAAIRMAEERMEKANPGQDAKMRAQFAEIMQEFDREMTDKEILDEALTYMDRARKRLD